MSHSRDGKLFGLKMIEEGDVILVRDRNFKYKKIGNYFVGEYLSEGFINEDSYGYDMLIKSKNPKPKNDFDIMTVMRPKKPLLLLSFEIEDCDLIFKRTETKKMTVEEVIEELGYEIEIIKG